MDLDSETGIEKYKSLYVQKRAKKFSGLRLFHGQVILWILRLPSKTAKLPSKVWNAVQTSWFNCSDTRSVCHFKQCYAIFARKCINACTGEEKGKDDCTPAVDFIR